MTSTKRLADGLSPCRGPSRRRRSQISRGKKNVCAALKGVSFCWWCVGACACACASCVACVCVRVHFGTRFTDLSVVWRAPGLSFLAGALAAIAQKNTPKKREKKKSAR